MCGCVKRECVYRCRGGKGKERVWGINLMPHAFDRSALVRAHTRDSKEDLINGSVNRINNVITSNYFFNQCAR